MIELAQLKMPAVSSECLHVMRLLASDEVDMHALVAAIALDPVLSSTLIKYANSPAHRRARETTSLQQAVNVLGMRQVGAAATIATMRGFSSKNPINSTLWDQSVVASTLARAVARRAWPRLADEAELIGLLHNMGALVLNTNYPDHYQMLADNVAGEGVLVHQAEREVFGLHRGDLIEPLAERFRLPGRVVEVLRAYYAQQLPVHTDSDEQRLLALLWVAQIAAWRSPAAIGWLAEFLPADSSDLLQQVGLAAEDLLDLGDDAETLVTERESSH